MSKMYFLPVRPAFDSAGITVPGSKHWFTLAGTNTPSAPFADAALTIPLENPVIANGVGYLPPVYLNETPSFYRVRIYLPHAEVGVDTPTEEYDPYIPALAILTYLGDTGFNGLLADAPTLDVPTGTDIVSTIGADRLDHGGANYVAGTAPTARSGFTSANTRNFVLSKEQVFTTDMFYQATDPDYQNAIQSGLDHLAAIAGQTVLTWYKGGAKLVIPARDGEYLLHDTIEPAHQLRIEGEGSGGFSDGAACVLRWTTSVTGFRFRDINTSGSSGVTAGPGTFAPTGATLATVKLIGNLDTNPTEGDFHAVQARTRIALDHVSMDKWQGDGFHINGDITVGGSNASLCQVDYMRATHIRNGVSIDGGDASVCNFKTLDIVYARRWAVRDNGFLANRFEGCHNAACGIQNIGYTPSVCSYLGNTYGLVWDQAVGASTNPPSGTTAHNQWWIYIGAGGPSVPLNYVAWTSGLTWEAGGGYLTSNPNASSTYDDCYDEGGQSPSQLPYLGLRVGGTSGVATKGARLGGLNGRVMGQDAICAYNEASAHLTVLGTSAAGEHILSHSNNTNIGGVNAWALDFSPVAPTILKLSMWMGAYTDDLVPIEFSTNNSPVLDAPYGVNRTNFPLGHGFGGKKRYPAAVAPTTARLVGDVDENTAPTATTPLKWITTAAGTPGTQILHFPNLRANPTVGIGYVTGAGAAVTQLTDKSTATPAINKVCGQVTMNNAALAAGAKVSFVVTNSTVAATDTIIVSVASGGTANAYRAAVTAISAGVSFTVTVENITAGSLSEAPVINFSILKAVAA